MEKNALLGRLDEMQSFLADGERCKPGSKVVLACDLNPDLFELAVDCGYRSATATQIM